MRKLDASKSEISFGSQIRSYVMQPYQLIKDHRTKVERGDVQKVLDGDIDTFIRAYLLYRREEGGVVAQAVYVQQNAQIGRSTLHYYVPHFHPLHSAPVNSSI